MSENTRFDQCIRLELKQLEKAKTWEQFSQAVESGHSILLQARHRYLALRKKHSVQILDSIRREVASTREGGDSDIRHISTILSNNHIRRYRKISVKSWLVFTKIIESVDDSAAVRLLKGKRLISPKAKGGGQQDKDLRTVEKNGSKHARKNSGYLVGSYHTENYLATISDNSGAVFKAEILKQLQQMQNPPEYFSLEQTSNFVKRQVDDIGRRLIVDAQPN